jgi:hypothetical protein
VNRALKAENRRLRAQVDAYFTDPSQAVVDLRAELDLTAQQRDSLADQLEGVVAARDELLDTLEAVIRDAEAAGHMPRVQHAATLAHYRERGQ